MSSLDHSITSRASRGVTSMITSHKSHVDVVLLYFKRAYLKVNMSAKNSKYASARAPTSPAAVSVFVCVIVFT